MKNKGKPPFSEPIKKPGWRQGRPWHWEKNALDIGMMRGVGEKMCHHLYQLICFCIVCFWGVSGGFAGEIGGGFGPYRAAVVRVYDGDTFTADVRVWPGQINRVHVRIEGVDTPEIRTRCAKEKELAKRARAALVALLDGGAVTLVHVRRGKYAGRMLARVLVDGADVAGVLIRRGLGREYHGGKRLPWCTH